MNDIISKAVSVVNPDTGEVNEYSNVLIENNKKFIQYKRGWTRMYRDGTNHNIQLEKGKVIEKFEIGYDGIVRELRSPLEHDIFTAIRDSYIPRTNTIIFNQTKLAKKLNTSRVTVARVVRKLKDMSFIRIDDDTLKMNPFIWIAPNLSNDDIHILQEDWKRLIGYEYMQSLQS
jgi:hypothetical protein